MPSLSIAAAVITIGMKSTAYALTGSVGLLTDALESVVNLIAAVTASLGAFIGLYALLFATGIFLIVRCVRRGPEALSA